MGSAHDDQAAGISPELVMLTAPRSPAAEAYRTLRTNVQFATLDRSARTLLVASAGVDEGASAVAANLAVAVAQAGKRVALVDADLRRPCLHRLFGLPNRGGLTDALLADQVDAPPLRPAGVEDLALLVAGTLPPNPAELLGSQRVQRLLAGLAARHDLVVLVAPPVTVVADASVLAPQVDGVLLVLAAGKTRRETAVRAKEQLAHVHAPVLGVVLHGARADERSVRAYAAGGDL
ncbi:MAG: CpsD/CapB family tyrosine-protein kinase [Chloroflexi bacterium]|nr:CpsD/CapB family tyrosine-protein kinase [Chloroflexota bacterium]